MTGDETTAVPADLPETLAIFPLQGVLLLPRGQLPLNVFEPRYLAMTEDALAGARMIGMIQPREQEVQEPDDRPKVYETGCAGRITSFSETTDGRYLITLTGVCRFDVIEELPDMRGYRRVAPAYKRFLSDLSDLPASDLDRDKLLETLKFYLECRSLSADWEAIVEMPTDDLVSALSMMCPFAPNEKQALLESAGAGERGDLMISLMEMESRGGPAAPEQGSATPH